MTEDGGLRSMGLQQVVYNLMDSCSSNPCCSRVHCIYIEVYNKRISIGNLNKLPVITTITMLTVTLEIIVIMTSYSLDACYGQMLC